MAANPTNSIKAALRQPDALRGLDNLQDRVERILENHRPKPKRTSAQVENLRSVEKVAKTA